MKKIIFDEEAMRRVFAQEGSRLREKIAHYRASGFEIVLSMPTSMSVKNDTTLPSGLMELHAFDGLFDRVVFGKPCHDVKVFHLDDKAVTIEEFFNLRYPELLKLVLPS